MRSARISFWVIFAFVIAVFLPAIAQDKAQVKVKGSEVVTGVVVVDVVREGKAFELQCNQGAAACTILKTGNYIMIELPKNYGMYDCRNAEIYPGDKADFQPSDRIGAYCLIQK